MAKLTEAQIKARQERLARAEQPVEAAAEADAAPAASLSVSLGQEETVLLGERSLQLAAFPILNVDRAYKLLDSSPVILTAQALAGKDGEPLALDALAEEYNRIAGRDGSGTGKEPAGVGDIADALANLPRTLSRNKKAVGVMLDLVHLGLQRRNPDVTRDEIQAEFDFGFFVRFVRALMRVNTGLRESF